MQFAETYFKRFKTHHRIFNNSNPRRDTGIIIVIPCYDEKDIEASLKSLEKAKQPKCNYEVIIVVNSAENTPENIKKINRDTFKQLKELSNNGTFKNFLLLPHLVENVQKKIAGVGNARKIGMDEALRRFDSINKNGVIVSLDADTIVSEEYLVKIEKELLNSEYGLAIFQFNHNFDNKKYNSEILNACKLYEIYLRYFRLSLEWSGFPYPIHTIGSCFAVKTDVYAKAGGMSKRQGGEDFYFLHKTLPITKYVNINTPIVFPSPRISNRVPFGTGPTVQKIITDKTYKVYNFKLFEILKTFFQSFKIIYQDIEKGINNIPPEILEYYGKENMYKTILECKNNTTNQKYFIKRMFSKFDAFWIIKFMNNLNDTPKFKAMDIFEAINNLISAKNHKHLTYSNLDDLHFNILEIDCQNL